MSKSVFLALATLLLTFPHSDAHATLTAHFRVHYVDNVCAADDSEPVTAGDPDLRYRMQIDNFASSVTAEQCGFFSTCGTWNFADRTLQRVITNNSSASFFFRLIDDDTDADDNMGAHALLGLGPGNAYRSAVEWNVDIDTGPNPHGPVCGEDTEGPGWNNNYRLSYEIWHEDSDGPLPLAAPVATNGGIPVTVDPNVRLDFSFGLPSDPNSGIASRRAVLFDQTSGLEVVNVALPLASTALSLCPAGCDQPFTALDGHLYRFHVSATNGLNPAIINPTTVDSPPVEVLIQVGPVAVDDPPASLTLSAPAPNPTTAGTAIGYSLPAAGNRRLEVIDLQGRRVAVLADGAASAGPHRIEWDGRNAEGRRVDSGVYWVRLMFGDARKLQRLVVIR